LQTVGRYRKRAEWWETSLDDLGQGLVGNGIRYVGYGLAAIAVGSVILLLTRE